MPFREVVAADELWEGEMLGVDVDGAAVVIARLPTGLVAYEDRCCHLAVRVSTGRLDGTTLTCTAHDWVYDAATGEGVNPRGVCLRRVPVRETDGSIAVDISGLPRSHVDVR